MTIHKPIDAVDLDRLERAARAVIADLPSAQIPRMTLAATARMKIAEGERETMRAALEAAEYWLEEQRQSPANYCSPDEILRVIRAALGTTPETTTP